MSRFNEQTLTQVNSQDSADTGENSACNSNHEREGVDPSPQERQIDASNERAAEKAHVVKHIYSCDLKLATGLFVSEENITQCHLNRTQG